MNDWGTWVSQVHEVPVSGLGSYDGQAQVLHAHSEGQLIYPVSGLLVIATAQATWVAAADQVGWTPAGCEHSHRAPSRTAVAAVVVPVRLTAGLPEQPAVFAVSPLAREALLVLAGRATHDDGARDRLTAVAVDELLATAPTSSYLPEPVDDRLRGVTALLRADLAEPRTLDDLGRAVGASARTLSRLFHAELGMGFHQWRTQLRLQHALGFLRQGRSVGQTAAMCGWASPSSFVEAFQGVTGTTPGRYLAAQRRSVSPYRAKSA